MAAKRPALAGGFLPSVRSNSAASASADALIPPSVSLLWPMVGSASRPSDFL